MKKIFTLLFLTVSLFATAQQNGAIEYMYIHRSNNVVDSIAVAEIDSVTFAVHGVPEIPDTPVTPPAGTQYEAVDLGLSVKWASCNVGATTPEDCGDYYAWGETEVKDYYDWSTYKWCNGSYNTLTKYCKDLDLGSVDNKTILDPEDDVAHVKWGGSWRMPTNAEQDELRNSCTWTWTKQNGVDGYKVTGPNGNSIFLPAVGGHYFTGVDGNGSDGMYWSSSLGGNYSVYAYSLYFNDGYKGRNEGDCRCDGRTVRPVCSEPAAPIYTETTFSFEHFENAKYTTWYEEDANGTRLNWWATANAGFQMSGQGKTPADFPTSVDSAGVKGCCVKLTTRSTGMFGKMMEMPIAPGNIFIGEFLTANATKAPLEATRFGLAIAPSRPVSLTGYYKYTPGEVFTNKTMQEIPERIDTCAIYSVLYEIDPENFEPLNGSNVLSSDRIVLVAQLENPGAENEWIEFEIPYQEFGGNIFDRKKLENGEYAITIVASSSKGGEVFEGAVGSTLYIDELKIKWDNK